MTPHAPSAGVDRDTAAVEICLVGAFRAGDESAFDALVARQEPRLRRLCRRYLRDEHAVDDILQECFARLLQPLRSAVTLDAGAWLHRTATNLCRDHLRRRRVRDSRAANTPAGAADGAFPELPDADPAVLPPEALDLALTRAMIRAAAGQLPPRQRSVLVLRDVWGLSQEDAAAALGMSPGAVQGTLFRARERFRAEYVGAMGMNDRPAECATVAYTLDTIAPSQLRADRLSALRRHARTCDSCRLRLEIVTPAA